MTNPELSRRLVVGGLTATGLALSFTVIGLFVATLVQFRVQRMGNFDV